MKRVQFCSQGGQSEAPEEKYENPAEITEGNETADLVTVRYLHNQSFRKEQEGDPTLSECSRQAKEGPLAPENPERYCVKEDILYREVLVNPRKGEHSQTTGSSLQIQSKNFRKRT